VVLDLIAAKKEWLGEIKHQIAGYTKIPLANICISCTHTHSAVSPVDVFQSNTDTSYLKWAAPRVSDCVRTAGAAAGPRADRLGGRPRGARHLQPPLLHGGGHGQYQTVSRRGQ